MARFPIGALGGTAIGANLGGPAGAAVGLSAGSILDDAFGGGGANWRGKYYRNQMQDRSKYEPGFLAANTAAGITGAVKGAKEAGLHPLFALGGSTAGSAGHSIPGQSQSGSFKTDGLGQALMGMANINAQKELNAQQLLASALRIAENNTGNDVEPRSAYDTPNLSSAPKKKAEASGGKAEYKAAEYGSYDKNNPTSTGSVSSLTSGIRIGDQVIQTMAQEGAEIAEDPAVMLGAAMLDKANRHIDWRRAIRDYTGMSHPRGYGRNRDSDVVRTKKYLWGLLKLSKSYQRTWGQGR